MCDCEEDGLKQQKPHRVPSLSTKSRPQFTHQKPFGLFQLYLIDTVKVGQESGGETRSKGAWVGLKPGTDSNPGGTLSAEWHVVARSAHWAKPVPMNVKNLIGKILTGQMNLKLLCKQHENLNPSCPAWFRASYAVYKSVTSFGWLHFATSTQKLNMCW